MRARGGLLDTVPRKIVRSIRPWLARATTSALFDSPEFSLVESFARRTGGSTVSKLPLFAQPARLFSGPCRNPLSPDHRRAGPYKELVLSIRLCDIEACASTVLVL